MQRWLIEDHVLEKLVNKQVLVQDLNLKAVSTFIVSQTQWRYDWGWSSIHNTAIFATSTVGN